MQNSNLSKTDTNSDKPTYENVKTAHMVQIYVIEPSTVLGLQLGGSLVDFYIN
jgi:hypothetical protein